MEVKRGDVWWADLGSPEGSEPGFRRPVIIVQSEAFNRSRIRTVVAVAVTSNLRLADSPGNVFIPKGQSGLPRDSVANVSHLVTLDRFHLTKRQGNLPLLVTRTIDRGLKLVLDL